MTTLDKSEPTSLGEALPIEMARVRDEVIPIYESIGRPGMFVVVLAKRALDDAARAMAEGDTVAMLRVYQTLKDIQT